MQYHSESKKSKRFSPGSDLTEEIFTGELSGVDSAGVLRQDVPMFCQLVVLKKILKCWLYNYFPVTENKDIRIESF